MYIFIQKHVLKNLVSAKLKIQIIQTPNADTDFLNDRNQIQQLQMQMNKQSHGFNGMEATKNVM